MKNWKNFTFSAKMSDETLAELQKQMPEFLERIGISEYNFDENELPKPEQEG